MDKKRDFWNMLDQLMPPGVTYTRIWSAFLTILLIGIGIWFAACISLVGEVENYKINLAQGLYQVWDAPPLITSADEMLHIFRTFSLYAMALLLCYTIPNYQYFRKDSKSVYLMKRVSDPIEIHKLCWTVPVMAAGTVLTLTVLLYAVFVMIYLVYVPEACLTAQTIGLFWRYVP